MQVRNNVLHHVSPELKSLYADLEGDFDPLNLSTKIAKCVEFVGEQEDLLKYVEPLREMAVIRLIKQVTWCLICLLCAYLFSVVCIQVVCF